MTKTRLVTTSIKDNEVKEDNLNTGAVTTAKLAADSVESSEINDGTVTADDLATSLDLSSKTVTLPNTSLDSQFFNISLLGFKMAVNESLTVFNLVDGVVDEFHDESGTDEAEGSNDFYCATSDNYQNLAPAPKSAGFSMTTITEPDTSTAGTNPAQDSGTAGSYTVPLNLTSLTYFLFGAGGGVAPHGAINTTPAVNGGGGGFSTGTLAVTPGQTINVSAGEGGWGGGMGYPGGSGPTNNPFFSGGRGAAYGGAGGGMAIITSDPITAPYPSNVEAPNIFGIAAGGGGGGGGEPGAAGGGLTGDAGGTSTAQTNRSPDGYGGGGGDQEQGGQAGEGGPSSGPGENGAYLFGGDAQAAGTHPQPNPQASVGGGGGAGFYGGGGGGGNPSGPNHAGGGGGSSYVGHPQVTSGSTSGGTNDEGGGVANPNYQASTNEGVLGSVMEAAYTSNPSLPGPSQRDSGTGEDGFVLLTGTGLDKSSTTIVSNAFTATSVPTRSRIVVFQENVDTPTLNTDIIASISRDGGSNFTTATLADSGYVTGSSGQRILTGQATISGQPSGQSMRWKLALANNQVKIHGVSLSWV